MKNLHPMVGDPSSNATHQTENNMRNDSPSNPLHRGILAVLFLALTAMPAAAQNAPDIIQSNETQVLDALGNAKLTIELKLTAKQYLMWKQKYGNNPSILKRDMGRLISQYETSNFNVEQNDMERQVRVTLEAKGVVNYRGGGQFEFKIPKDWTGGQRVNNEYRFNYIQTIGPGALMQHNVVTVLPAGASGIEDQLGEDGEKIIRYHLPTPGRSTGWLIGAVVFGLLGVAGIVMSFLGGNKSVAAGM